MNPGRRLRRAAAAGLLWLALFSLIYTVGQETGAWPKLPPGAFRNLDLVAGLSGGAVLLAILLWPGKSRKSAARGEVDRDGIG